MYISSKYNWLKHIDFIVLDLLSLIISFFISFYIKKNIQLARISLTVEYRIFLILIILYTLLFSVLFNAYSDVLKRNTFRDVRKMLLVSSWVVVFSSVSVYLLKIGELISRQVYLVTFALYLIISTSVRFIYKLVLINRRSSIVDENSKKLLIVTDSLNGDDLGDLIENSDLCDYKVIGYCVQDSSHMGVVKGRYASVTNIDDLLEYINSHNVNDILFNYTDDRIDADYIRNIINNKITVHFSVKTLFKFVPENVYTSSIDLIDTVSCSEYSFSLRQLAYIRLKRLTDILLSLFGVACVGLLSIFIFILNKCSGDYGPVFYKQERIGYNGVPFTIYKFRSMYTDADLRLEKMLVDDDIKHQWEEYHKIDNDPRVTKIGKILRKSSLDELPQFFNILKGDMSLIGPRPLMRGELEYHNGSKLYEQVKPGLTSWWACNGRSNISYNERLNLEYYYVKNCCFSLDIICFLKTIAIVIKKSGAK